MRNLKTETINYLSQFNYTKDDVAWVGLGEGGWDYALQDPYPPQEYMSFEAFLKAANAEYDAGYGGENVNSSLVIVMKDGSYLERHDYDGAEWWEIKRTPQKPDVDVSDQPWPELRSKIFYGYGDEEW